MANKWGGRWQVIRVLGLVCACGVAGCELSGDAGDARDGGHLAALPTTATPAMPTDGSPKDEDELGFKVGGVVVRQGRPVEGVAVSIESLAGGTTRTDAHGAFTIANVPIGEYELSLSEQDEGQAFGALTTPITVTQNLDLPDLLLPQPVALESPSKVTGGSMSLSWMPSESQSFREYKLYRHLSSGLDETTGTLVHVGTAVDDTTFVDEGLKGDEKYFYRVFVLDDYGLLGGSNVVSATTLNPCAARQYTAEILGPTDGATGVSTDTTVRIEWGTQGIPDRYTAMQSETGTYATYVNSGVSNGGEWARYELGPSTKYTFEIGWFCLETATEQTFVLDSVTFTTGP
jgi:hypothetical protein